MRSLYQNTLNEMVQCDGVGLHSGKKVRMLLKPAKQNTGIVFRREDLPNKPFIKACYDSVIDTRYGTTIGNREVIEIKTVEHLMAAFMGTGVDNVEVILSSCEVPVMDGSSKNFVGMINSTGLKKQISRKKSIKVLKEVSVSLNNKNILIRPSEDFSIKYHIDFSDPANFAHYGSAEEYFKNSIERVYKTYPYDGSLYEKTSITFMIFWSQQFLIF